jgi:subtilisin-like proprotein convertase family protein
MTRGRSRLAALAAFVLFVCVPTTPLLAAGPAGELRLKVETFDPLVARPELADDLKWPAEPGSGYFVVQFDRQIRVRMLADLHALGVETLGYLPDRAYLVRLPAGVAGPVRALPEVRWLGAVEPGWKLAPDLGTRPYQDPARREGGQLYATADLFPGEDPASVIDAVEATGAELIQLLSFADTRRLKLHATYEQLKRVAHVPGVHWIEEVGEITTRNNTTRWVIQTDVVDATSVWDHGLHGEGQIVGHIDNRIDMNSCYFRDPVDNTVGPNHRKVVAYRSNAGQGAESHGTHTAGTVAGDQTPINGTLNNAGNAYAAKLSHSRLADISGSGTQPSNLYDYLSDAHTDGARVHTNSWGDDGTTAYTTWCVDIDQFSYDFEESLVLFAETNTSTLRTPENAKNVLAVGASQNGTGNDTFCSGGRGPTSDGRRKPEIFAPGCSIVSARNQSTCSTRTSTGTSMACPAVTAAGALVRQYFTEGWYPSGTPRAGDALVPSGALIKAALLNSAVDMTGISGYPSNQEGWGRVLLENALFFDGDIRTTSVLADVRNADGLSTGQEELHTLTVNDAQESLRVTLVFTDPPAALLAANAAVNDLDLEVESPSGQTYLGNAIDTATGVSVTGGSPDAINNVEMAILDSPEVGEWTVRIRGAAVNQDTQGYALIASGQVEPFTPGLLRHESHLIQDGAPLGNNDGLVDPGESVTMPLTLRNNDSATASGILVALKSDQPSLVRITEETATFPDISPDGTAQSQSPHYAYTVAPGAACGTRVRFTALTSSSQGEGQTSFVVEVGNSHIDAPAGGLPLSIPKKSSSGISSTVDVTDAFTIRDVNIGLDIGHGDVGELVVTLSSPQGTTVTLHDQSRAGTADIVTVYDRDRQPDGPGSMADFDGESSQGTWTLRVVDNQGGPVKPGSLRAWTLELDATSPISCSPLDCGADPVPGAVPATLTVVEEGAADLQLTWDPVAGATAYRVWRSATASFELEELIGTPGVTSFVDVGAAATADTWFYRVRAINSCDWEGP